MPEPWIFPAVTRAVQKEDRAGRARAAQDPAEIFDLWPFTLWDGERWQVIQNEADLLRQTRGVVEQRVELNE